MHLNANFDKPNPPKIPRKPQKIPQKFPNSQGPT